MSEKKGDKKFTVTSVLCVILVTSIVTTVAFYSSILSYKDDAIASLNSEITNKDGEISLLNAEKDDLQTQIDSLNSEKDGLQSQIDGLDGQIDTLNEIIGLDKSEVWLDNYYENVTAGSYIPLNKVVDYAGYIIFDKIGGDSTTETGEIYAQVSWYTNDLVFYEQKMVVGKDAFFRFPVLPTSNLEVRIGYDDPSNGTANIIVAITYVY